MKAGAAAIAPSAPFGQMTSAMAGEIEAAAARLRAAVCLELGPERIAAAIAEACARWRERDFAPRRETIAEIAAAWGYTEAILDESIDALIAPFTRDALAAAARDAKSAREEIGGLIMPGNVPGAGMHEVATALIAGHGLMIKTASAEPVFFARFARSLTAIDAAVGQRTAVFNWSRDDAAANAAMRTACDWIAVYGDDETVAKVRRQIVGERAIAFGSRVSAAIVTAGSRTAAGSRPDAGSGTDEVAEAIARDVSLFEQMGCLSPHRVFVEAEQRAEGRDAARRFAQALAAALERFAMRFPAPRRFALEDASTIRRVRESARWRMIGGEPVELYEGGGMGESFRWTVVYDEMANFSPSPGYRTVTISPFFNFEDLKKRLEPAAGRIEAIAIAGPEAGSGELRRIAEAMGASHVCAPGAMQSPPLDWPHGGSAFARMIRDTR